MLLYKKLKSYYSNRDGKVVAKNFIWLSILQLVNYTLPIVTLPYLAHVIGVNGFGKVSFAAAVIIWFQTITDWGFNYTATRDIARNKDDKDTISMIFSTVLFARVFLMLLCFIMLIVLIICVPVFQSNALILLVSFSLIIGHILFPVWLFQGLERMQFVTILNAIARFLFTFCVFIFIIDEDDYILQPLLTSLGYLISGVISLYIIFIRWKVKIIPQNLIQIIQTLRHSADVFINDFIPNLYNSFSIVLMGFWGGTVANGQFDAGSKFVNIIIQFSSILSQAFFPLLSRNIWYHKKYACLNFYIVLLFSIGLFLLAPFLIHIFFTPEFDNAIIVTRILAVSLPFLSLSSIYGKNYLIIVREERRLRNVTCLASLIGFILAIPMVLFFTYIGAAITIAFTRSLLGLLIFIAARKVHGTKLHQNI